MKKKLLILTLLIISSCYPVKEIISENYKIDNDLEFTILKYSEPTNNPGYIRSNDDKFITLKIKMTNKSLNSRVVKFDKYYLVNDKKNFRAPLWKVNRFVEKLYTENKSVKFNGLETKNLYLKFLVPKKEQINYLIFDDQLIELKFGKIKKTMF
ncbi:hypothetical protein [Tenacibaculum sp. 190524A05c]|uniref:hypothetical protein n=1 Tax=Tenacibaculum platacis TaxID=3137852 RepID=UPI0032B17C57